MTGSTAGMHAHMSAPVQHACSGTAKHEHERGAEQCSLHKEAAATRTLLVGLHPACARAWVQAR